ncbi:hypothetical protein [Agromyces archimandritae]|uniref:Alcohol dehydrogenase n=1 Tax=Agromyces archimandritae TaxID=2781962 RepID=A0A975FKR6_9MICO|nr:hypothetical protein [Agromyces archimandritae]QTX04323.1 hypothetical protein G127AT_13745 [Agromyces archimandritae]
MYRAGNLKLDELITHTYTLDEINDAYDDMRAGKNIRGVIRFAAASEPQAAAEEAELATA